jgi:hypothetical protein
LKQQVKQASGQSFVFRSREPSLKQINGQNLLEEIGEIPSAIRFREVVPGLSPSVWRRVGVLFIEESEFSKTGNSCMYES